MTKPGKELLEWLYTQNKTSPERIAESFGVHGRTVRNWMRGYGIPRLGPSHLRRGVPNPANAQKSPEQIERIRAVGFKKGAVPHNKGQGDASFCCAVCGVSVTDKPYRRKKYCSADCRSLDRGESHWNYKDGGETQKQRRRNWKDYKEWRAAVLAKCGYTCEKCGKVGGRLSAHHKNGWADFPDQRLDVGNGACLCTKCHRAFHSEYGTHGCTSDMYDEWITMRR